jgi:hypothetical protein
MGRRKSAGNNPQIESADANRQAGSDASPSADNVKIDGSA